MHSQPSAAQSPVPPGFGRVGRHEAQGRQGHEGQPSVRPSVRQPARTGLSPQLGEGRLRAGTRGRQWRALDPCQGISSLSWEGTATNLSRLLKTSVLVPRESVKRVI